MERIRPLVAKNYDFEWYIQDVKDCLTLMKRFRKLLKEGVVGYAVFSW